MSRENKGKSDIAAKRRKNRKNIKERKEQLSRKKAHNTQNGLKKGQISRKKAQEVAKAKKNNWPQRNARSAKGFWYRITEVCFWKPGGRP